MTGLHTGHTPSRGNREVQPVGQFPIPADTLTIAEVLKEHGYATSAFGKWGLGFPGSEGDLVKQGFERTCSRNSASMKLLRRRPYGERRLQVCVGAVARMARV